MRKVSLAGAAAALVVAFMPAAAGGTDQTGGAPAGAAQSWPVAGQNVANTRDQAAESNDTEAPSVMSPHIEANTESLPSPMSARSIVQTGPDRIRDRSTTNKSSSGFMYFWLCPPENASQGYQVSGQKWGQRGASSG